MPGDGFDHDQAVVSARAALIDRLPAHQVHVSGPEYARGIALWNGAAEQRPAIVLTCTSTDDVVIGVRTAREFGLPLSVRGRGHNHAGFALAEGGLTLDIRPLNSVRVDPRARTAEVGGGAAVNDLLAAAGEHGLVAATGTVGTVGVSGLTLGGGYGPLNGVAGLAADNLLGAEVVTADGSVVDADEGLLWALRGGGGNFGVVTSMTVRLHAVPQVVSGLLLYPWHQARQVLEGVREAMENCPDSLTIQTAVIVGPDGSPGLAVIPTWSGDVEAGLDPEGPAMALTRLGDLAVGRLAAAPQAAVIASLDAMFPDGRNVVMRTRNVPSISDELIDSLAEFGDRIPTPFSALVLHHFHGASTRVAPDATAFDRREPHLMIEIIGIWEGEDAGDRVRAWADAASEALADQSFPGGYVNNLGPEATEQIAHLYGENLSRLQQVKAKWDPEGLFSATPLPAAGA
ncbi:FAD-binding oxidoreductase [Lentzea albida]|uniref:FAD/FMN-containing dehydrogenase n=1 Tax=Lentzea albida TaxID=65499 RepID=A0A1H9GV18_9PSEU|nr:FAD-binding oxidoreductase [Lentzea albida]SEQ53880.1 FAD/FMN-containing dehydrogenase [Lentzea albida]